MSINYSVYRQDQKQVTIINVGLIVVLCIVLLGLWLSLMWISAMSGIVLILYIIFATIYQVKTLINEHEKILWKETSVNVSLKYGSKINLRSKQLSDDFVKFCRNRNYDKHSLPLILLYRSF